MQNSAFLRNLFDETFDSCHHNGKFIQITVGWLFHSATDSCNLCFQEVIIYNQSARQEVITRGY